MSQYVLRREVLTPEPVEGSGMMKSIILSLRICLLASPLTWLKTQLVALWWVGVQPLCTCMVALCMVSTASTAFENV